MPPAARAAAPASIASVFPVDSLAMFTRMPKGRVKGIGVYTGSRALMVDDVRVLPWKTFLEELWAGRLLA